MKEKILETILKLRSILYDEPLDLYFISRTSRPSVPEKEESKGDEKVKILEEIAREVAECKKCELWKYRTNVVPGEGNPNAVIMFIGEAPGAEEDAQGRPFVGKAGKLLTQLIEDVLKLRREDVYIANVLKCRPPGNRDPQPLEVHSCLPYLRKQIETIKPKIIVLLGRHAMKAITGIEGITKYRGQILDYGDYKIVPTVHPAAVLRRENELMPQILEDFKKIRQLYEKICER